MADYINLSSFAWLSLFLINISYRQSLFCLARCFVRRLNCRQKDECCCDEPSMQTTFNDIPSSRAFVSCSWTCSNNSQCLAFNFNQNSKLCQMFHKKSLKCFQRKDDCFHMSLKGKSDRQFNIRADDKIVSLYFDGVPQKELPNWDAPLVYNSHSLPYDVQVVAVHATNSIKEKYIEAFSDDGAIASNTTWKCSTTSPALDSNNNNWYDVHYDDASWSAAMVQESHSFLAKSIKFWSEGNKEAYCRTRICG
ncbi:hypothetical protein HELRODRAFT_174032 [Helobdella robusta]|uniref:Apple domain-containing protein n=1 Tax=Helobdella robusta TaxID=6412 RepID=T1F7I3_HELRO|nr:hypothetical protein HELRODRAFT_174032 [Helobdella robusta]ESO03139.1 hypothetical protein HELRODRAFT_174032 [Helobdella robusta]